MIIIVDAYNVIKSAFPELMVGTKERKQFVALCGHYGKQRGHKMIIVFDGGPFDYPSKEKESGSYVVYAGAQQLADDYIKEYIKDHCEQDLLVVSSDFGIYSYADSLKIESIGAQEFYELLRAEGLSTGRSEVQYHRATRTALGDEDDEVDELMEEYDDEPFEKVEDYVIKKDRRSPSKQWSKEERIVMKKVRKL